MSLMKRIAIALMALYAGSGALFAQAKDGFVPADTIQTENLPALPLLYIAYALVWLVLIGYLFLLWKRLSKVEKELREVSSRISTARR